MLMVKEKQRDLVYFCANIIKHNIVFQFNSPFGIIEQYLLPKTINVHK